MGRKLVSNLANFIVDLELNQIFYASQARVRCIRKVKFEVACECH